jgi:hypothetical protein
VPAHRRCRFCRVRLPLIAFGVALSLTVAACGAGGRESAGLAPGERDVTAWAPPDALPVSDVNAAALVTPAPETQPENEAANRYVPTAGQLAAFHAAQRAAVAAGLDNPLTAYVSGRPGLKDPSTDDLVQWVSHKWGIPTAWIRAQLIVESGWNQGRRGDLSIVTAAQYAATPASLRGSGRRRIYASAGIAQVKAPPFEATGAGTALLRWRSTAFNLDYYGAAVRYYYDGYCDWCSAGYHAGEAWRSIGAWDSPQPWANATARAYVDAVRSALSRQPWTNQGL